MIPADSNSPGRGRLQAKTTTSLGDRSPQHQRNSPPPGENLAFRVCPIRPAATPQFVREAVATTVAVLPSIARKKLRNLSVSFDLYPSRLCAQR